MIQKISHTETGDVSYKRGCYDKSKKRIYVGDVYSAVAGVRRYIHNLDIKRLESMTNYAWQPRMSLLPPFDNLICGRDRTNRVFSFDYNHEMFLPQNKRKFGYYVLPILWGDRFIGRVDPLLGRRNEKLLINSVHAEPGAPGNKEVASMIKETIERLAEFLGAWEVAYSTSVPAPRRSYLR